MVRSSSWVPANEPVVLAGYRIAGGLIYFGHSCRSAAGTTEPAQINPGLPVDPPSSARPVHDLGQAPAYHLISSAHRAAYLRWLARGRTGDDVPLGLLHLFCSGLERRVLLDARTDPAARGEFEVIAAELRRLRDLYGGLHAGFGPRISALLEVLELLAASPRPPFLPAAAVPPPVVPDAPRWPVPPALRIWLAQLANAGQPVPPGWARCWAWYHPALFPTMSQTRCPQEFDRLFALRYRRRLPAGITPAGDGRPPVRIGYLPINPAMDTVVVERPELPDVLEEPAATRQLAAVVAEASSALTPYSRWLGRTPGGRNSVASTVLLPDDLLQDEPGPLRPLLDWATGRLGAAATAVIDAGEFAPFWSSADPRRMSRDEATSLAVVLARLGLGVEPDARFGGPALGSGPAVLFRLGRQGADGGTTAPASIAFRTACHVLAVVAAVWPGVADLAGSRSGPATNLPATDHPATDHPIAGRDALVNRTVTALAAEVRLSVDERTRLGARLRWLLEAGADPQPVRRRAGSLTGEQRETGAQVLLRLAVETGPVGPEMVAALATGYRLLGLPEDQLYPQLHQATAEQHGPRPSVNPTRPVRADPTRPARVHPTRPARAAAFPAPAGVPEPVPVLARRGRQGDAGHPLPWARNTAAGPSPDRPSPDRPSSHQQGAWDEAGVRLQLRPELIGRRQAETEAVGTLLAEVFAADDAGTTAGATAGPIAATSTPPGPGPGPAAGTAPAAGLIAGLDIRHHGLLAELASRPSWTGKELGTLAAGFGVLPAGALDLINEVAIERTGQPLVEVDAVIDAGTAASADDEGDENDERDEVLTVDVTVARELLR